MTNFNIAKSIEKGRLIHVRKIDMILDKISFSVIILILSAFLWLPLIDLFSNSLLKIGYFVIVLLLSLIISHLKWNRTMRIFKVVTKKSKNENKLLINDLIKDKGYVIPYNNRDYIEAYKRNEFLLFSLETHFLIREKEIYVNSYYFDSKFNWPSIKKTKRLISGISKSIDAIV